MSYYYDRDIDYLEVVESYSKSYGEPVNKCLVVFKAESDGSVLGFSLEEASSNMRELLRLPVKFRMAGLIYVLRKKENLSQVELQDKTGVSRRTIQRIEKGELGISLENLTSIMQKFPQYDFSILLEPQKIIDLRSA